MGGAGVGGSWAVLYLAPVVGTVCAQLMFASPMPAVLRARQENNLRDLNVVPFPLIVANCVGWIVYSEAPAAPYLLPCRCHPLSSPLDPPQCPSSGPAPIPAFNFHAKRLFQDCSHEGFPDSERRLLDQGLLRFFLQPARDAHGALLHLQRVWLCRTEDEENPRSYVSLPCFFADFRRDAAGPAFRRPANEHEEVRLGYDGERHPPRVLRCASFYRVGGLQDQERLISLFSPLCHELAERGLLGHLRHGNPGLLHLGAQWYWCRPGGISGGPDYLVPG